MLELSVMSSRAPWAVGGGRHLAGVLQLLVEAQTLALGLQPSHQLLVVAARWNNHQDPG
jgi:hypothetical protein